MEFRSLGRTGVSVSKFCFGAGMFGYFGNNDEKECKRMVDHAISEGINYFERASTWQSVLNKEKITGPTDLGRKGHPRPINLGRAAKLIPWFGVLRRS